MSSLFQTEVGYDQEHQTCRGQRVELNLKKNNTFRHKEQRKEKRNNPLIILVKEDMAYVKARISNGNFNNT